MPAQTPEQCDELLGQYLGEGNLDAGLTLYEPQASVVKQDGKSASGTAAIREFFKAFAAARPKLSANIVNVVKAGDDLALVYNDWSAELAGSDGSPRTISGKALEVVRRQRDGTWLFAIDIPNARG